MRKAIYHTTDGKEVEVEYDDNAPCLVCGEPVIGASMGGTAICGSCDCGRCRYCGMSFFVYKEKIDDGASKKALLKHMEWHHKNTPDIVKKANSGLRNFLDVLEKEREERKRLQDDGTK